MKLNSLEKSPETKVRKRVGRGIGSGTGKTSGKGHKGQKARSGGGVRRGFEGGQTPLYRRLPKRGFTNIHAKNYTEVTLTMLNKSKATVSRILNSELFDKMVDNNEIDKKVAL